MQEPRVGGKSPVVMDLREGSRTRHPSNYGPHRSVDGDQEGRAPVAPDPEATPQPNASGLVVNPEAGRVGVPAPD